jgi:hypothetical protein
MDPLFLSSQDKYAEYYHGIHFPWYYVWISLFMQSSSLSSSSSSSSSKGNHHHHKTITIHSVLKGFEKDAFFTLCCHPSVAHMDSTHKKTINLEESVHEVIQKFFDDTQNKKKDGDDDVNKKEDEMKPSWFSVEKLKHSKHGSIVLVTAPQNDTTAPPHWTEFSLKSLKLIQDPDTEVPLYQFEHPDTHSYIHISPITNQWWIGTHEDDTIDISNNNTSDKNGGGNTGLVFRLQASRLGERRVDKTVFLFEQ